MSRKIRAIDVKAIMARSGFRVSARADIEDGRWGDLERLGSRPIEVNADRVTDDRVGAAGAQALVFLRMRLAGDPSDIDLDSFGFPLLRMLMRLSDRRAGALIAALPPEAGAWLTDANIDWVMRSENATAFALAVQVARARVTPERIARFMAGADAETRQAALAALGRGRAPR